MKSLSVAAIIVSGILGAACSKHDCDLEAAGDKEKFGEIAEMTGGAHHCMVSSGELIATHPEKSVGDISSKYETFLKSKSYEVEIKDHKSQRANGKELDGKLVIAKNGSKEVTTLVYLLTDNIVETVTTAK